MKKGVFTELVILRVNGGVLNDEANTQRVDVEAFLPAAVNYAITAGRNVAIAEEGNRDYPSQFYGTFSDLVIDRSTNTPFITLPKGYVPLYGNEGIRSVVDNCGNSYSPVMEADRRTIKYYLEKMGGQGFYFPIGKTKVEVYSPNPLVEKLSGEYIVSVEELGDEDELPLVASTETMALNLCVEWITGQREIPADLKNNKNDINTVS